MNHRWSARCGEPVDEIVRARVARLVPGDGPLVVHRSARGSMADAAWVIGIASMLPDIRFAFVGDALAHADAAAHRNVSVLPAAPEPELHCLLHGASLPVGALAFSEALDVGTPVAMRDGTWQAALLQRWGAGLVLPRDDLRRAASMLRRAAYDRPWRAQASEAARALARERFARRRPGGQAPMI